MPPNRIVALATPLVAPLAGALAAWLSQNVPGVEIPASMIEEVFLLVLGVVGALALQFNHNRFKWDVEEQRAALAGDATAPDDFELDDDDELDAEDDLDVDDDEPFDDDDELPDDELELGDIDDDIPTPVR
jgi:hypothetical protein